MPSLLAARLGVVVFLLAPALAGCGNEPSQSKGAPPPPTVTIVKPVEGTIVDQDEYVGRFVAVDSVEIRARVWGYLEAVHFTDGQMVKKGDLLFTMDRRPYQVALDQARATLAQVRANLAFAEADLARAQQLVRDRTITEQTFDQRTQAKRVAEASVAANTALVHQAEIDPIRFEFTFDEASYLRYERFAKRSRGATPGTDDPVKLKLLGESDFRHQGQIDFVDNAISQSSGTIRGRAVFPNRDGLFTPGMFGRIQVPGSPPYQALLVPDVAIATEQARKFVYALDATDTARQKYVTLGALRESLRIIKDGLAADDRVIVDGLATMRPGTKVKPQEAPPAAPGRVSKAQ